jgi:predicted house-cleaning noncanonical NTP pyrophosphatase (MazG superfamily)
MSNFINHIKLATENIVLCSSTGISKKDHYDYAEKMEKMLKRQLKEELQEIVADSTMMEERLCEFINKL